MGPNREHPFPVLAPNLQISFYYRLQSLRALCLHDALKKTVAALELAEIDEGLLRQVANDALRKVASFGLRGEVLFPVPVLIEANPFLLGYYRLLLGLSQKEFYNKGPFGRFKRLEERGELPDRLRPLMPALCASMIASAEAIVEAIDELSLPIVHELQLLTLGPQFRGGENTRLGQEATRQVFSLIRDIVLPYLKETTHRTMRIVNDSGRTVMIEFFADPDVRITERLPSGVRPLVAIEIKGGTDASNIHNRLGEAEKSHLKAKNLGFFEFWTLLRIDADAATAKRDSPTTTRFFHLDRIAHDQSPEHAEFRELLGSRVGIRAGR